MATTPAAGGRRSSNLPRAHGNRRTSCRPTGTRSRSRWTWPATTAGRRWRPWWSGPMSCSRTSAPGVLDRLGLSDRAAARAQPGPGGALDQRLRSRRARGRPRRLRPDRPGRGRADVAHRPRTRGAHEGRATHRRPAGRDVRRVRRARRPARARPTPAAARWSDPRCWSAVVGIHTYQGTRWTVAGEVGLGAGQPPPVHLAVRAVSLPGRRRADLRRQRGAVAAAVRGVRPGPADPRDWTATPSGSPIARR